MQIYLQHPTGKGLQTCALLLCKFAYTEVKEVPISYYIEKNF